MSHVGHFHSIWAVGGNCARYYLLLVFAGLDEMLQVTFILVSCFGVWLNDKNSLSVFSLHSINLIIG